MLMFFLLAIVVTDHGDDGAENDQRRRVRDAERGLGWIQAGKRSLA